MDGTDEPLVESFWALSRKLRAMAQEALAEWDVTPSQARALRVLSSRDEGMRPSALADELRIAPHATRQRHHQVAGRVLGHGNTSARCRVVT